MQVPKVNSLFRLLDILLIPFMWVLGKSKFPLQETHIWHLRQWDWRGRGLFIPGTDIKARFHHSSGYGLFHMPILGGLTHYVVIEASNPHDHWYIGWTGSIQLLTIKQNRIKLLTGKEGYEAYGLDAKGDKLKLKVVGFGRIGDGKYKGTRLF